jgi:hypothetical protein
MQPSMKTPERLLLESLLRVTDHYLEFGSGGSTCLAAAMVGKSVTSVDSSAEWLDKVAEECRAKTYPVQPRLIRADIGQTGSWGWPVDAATKTSWPKYHSDVWNEPGSANADTYLVDGRFRVACVMQVLLHARSDAVIAVHDFHSRPHFHVIKDVAKEVARAEDLSVFVRKGPSDPDKISSLLRKYALVPQ